MVRPLTIAIAVVALCASANAATITFQESTTIAGYAPLGISISGADLLQSTQPVRDNIFLNFTPAGGDEFGLWSSSSPHFATAASPIRIDFTTPVIDVTFDNIVRNRPNIFNPPFRVDFTAQAFASDGSLVDEDVLVTFNNTGVLAPWTTTLSGESIAYVLFYGGINDPTWNLGIGELSFTPLSSPGTVPGPASGLLLAVGISILGTVRRLRRVSRP